MGDELQKIDSFKYKIAIAETYEEFKKLDDIGAVMQEFAKRQKLSFEKQNDIGKMRIDIEQKKGSWLNDNFPHGRNQHAGGGSTEEPPIMPATKKESSRARLISEADEKDIENIEQKIIETGEVITPAKVEKELRKEEKKKELENKKEEYNKKIESAKTKVEKSKIDIYNTDKKFRIIYADPPWQYDYEQTSPQLGGAVKHYNSMPFEQICCLPINKITDKNSVLFLWITSPKLNLFLELMSAWGFEYKTSFVWDKVKHNMGHYNSVRHEFLLIGGKGKSVPDVKKLHDSVISIERSEIHSEKPIEFMNIIDELYIYGERLELFCRKSKKENWYFWGNEV